MAAYIPVNTTGLSGPNSTTPRDVTAREHALTKAQLASKLARRPYDLRHACLSLWLNAGVPPQQVAEWAGHSLNVLLRVYAKCLDGADELAKRRIVDALQHGGADATPDTGKPANTATSRRTGGDDGPNDGSDAGQRGADPAL